MVDYRTSSGSFREYLSINGIRWEDCQLEILMESIYEKPVRRFEEKLNCVDYKDDEFCWSRNTGAVYYGCLERLYMRTCKHLKMKYIPSSPLEIMIDIIEKGLMIKRERFERLEQVTRKRLERARIRREYAEQTRLERIELEKRELEKRERLERYKIKLLRDHTRAEQTRQSERERREREFRLEHPELFDWEPTADFT